MRLRLMLNVMKIMRKIKSYRLVLKNQYRPLKFIISRILMECGLSGFFTIYRNRYRIKFFPTAVSLTLWINSKERLDGEIFLTKYLKVGDNVIDVGSNIGTLTLAAASIVGEKGKVLSIEPHPRTFKYLMKNIHLNPFKNILPLNVAVGEKGKYVNFSSKKSDDLNRVLKNTEGLKIPMVRLDEVVGGELKIALLKIDVEGYEKFVIVGADNIMRNVDCIYFESYEEHFKEYGYSTIDLILEIRRKGFEVYKILDDKIEILEGDYKSMVCENLIAIRNIDEFIRRTGFQVKNN